MQDGQVRIVPGFDSPFGIETQYTGSVGRNERKSASQGHDPFLNTAPQLSPDACWTIDRRVGGYCQAIRITSIVQKAREPFPEIEVDSIHVYGDTSACQVG